MEETLELADWRRRVSHLYAQIRDMGDPQEAWHLWVHARTQLFIEHPQSPVPQQEREGFMLQVFSYDPAARTFAQVVPAQQRHIEIPTSGDTTMGFTHFGNAVFELFDATHTLPIYWLDGYAGGLFLPFKDATSGKETYGAGRYLIDAAKGADLGTHEGQLIFDFNFAYPPSCSYDSRWACPLAPPGNQLEVALRAGEKTVR